jgi:hypothetical protein
MDVGPADGTSRKPLGMVRNMLIYIDGVKFEINVIFSKDKKGQDYPLILGRSFMETAKSLVDLELKEVFIRSNGYYQCYKVTSPLAYYKLAMEVADDREAFKTFIEGSSHE